MCNFSSLSGFNKKVVKTNECINLGFNTVDNCNK